MNLYAVSGTFVLLENNKPKLIGEAHYTTRTQDGHEINCAEIKFHYGSEHTDYFYFENDVLIVCTVYEGREKYVQDCYNYCMNEMTAKEFVEEVIEAYTVKEMGF